MCTIIRIACMNMSVLLLMLLFLTYQDYEMVQGSARYLYPVWAAHKRRLKRLKIARLSDSSRGCSYLQPDACWFSHSYHAFCKHIPNIYTQTYPQLIAIRKIPVVYPHHPLMKTHGITACQAPRMTLTTPLPSEALAAMRG
jgi:hypothetical protein